MAITGCQLQNVTADGSDMPGLRQAGDVVDLNYRRSLSIVPKTRYRLVRRRRRSGDP